MVAVPRRQRAGLDLELLQRIGERRRQVQVVERIVVGPAVHDVGDAVGLAAGDRDGDGRDSSCSCSGRRLGADVARPDRKISSVAWRPFSGISMTCWLSITWPTPVDRVSTVAALAATVTCSPTLPTASATSMVGFGVDLQDDALLHVGVEPLQDDLQRVRADRQVRKHIGAVGAREHRADRAGVGLGDRHLDARQHAAARVLDDT